MRRQPICHGMLLLQLPLLRLPLRCLARLLILPLLAAPWLPARAAPDTPALLRFCAEDENSYPWMLKDRPGLNLLMIRMMEPRLGLRIEVQLQPWRRCLLSLQEGMVDGAFKASFREERLKFGLYPMLAGKPDPSRQMLEESYHLYRLRGTAVEWDGSQLRGLDGAIGAQSGFSIVEQLRGMGLVVDDGAKAAETILTKLQRGRIGAAALQTSQGDYALASDPVLAASFERVGPPLSVKAYYLMLSRQLFERHPALVERIWQVLAQVRESPDYKQAQQSFK